MNWIEQQKVKTLGRDSQHDYALQSIIKAFEPTHASGGTG